MSLTTPPSVQKLQTALHDKAKEIARAFASMRCTTRCTEKTFWHSPTNAAKPIGGAAGVDGQTFEDIEEYGVQNGGWTNWRKS